MGVRIQELPETTGINKEDVLIVEDGQGTKKGTVQQLDEALGVSQLKEDLDYLETTVCGKNLLNVSSCETNKYLHGNGTLENYNGRYVTDFIPVEQGMKLVGTYTLWGKQNLYDFSSIVLYDINKNLVSGGVYNTNKYTIPSGVSYVRCTIHVNLIDYSGQIELTEDGTPTPYEPYVEPYKKLTDEVIEKSNLVTKEYVDSNLEGFILCSLPSKMYVLEGRTIEIYNSQVLFNSDNFDLSWSSNLGIVRFKNRIRYTMGSGNSGYAGYIDLTIIKNDKIIATKRTELYRVPMPSSNVYAMAFGDSLTNHCVWESEAMNICNKLLFVGSRSRNVADSDGETRLIYHEGRAGFSTFDYTSGKAYMYGSDSGGNESVNRWYDGSKFSTSYYFANHFPPEQNPPTSFNYFMGMNDLTGSKTVDEIISNIKVMIDDIVSYNNSMKISVCSPQLRWEATYEEKKKFMQFAIALEELCKTYNNVVYVPLIIGMDSENNYNMKDETINTRSTEKEKVSTDMTHPANSGYWQMADWIVGAIVR